MKSESSEPRGNDVLVNRVRVGVCAPEMAWVYEWVRLCGRTGEVERALGESVDAWERTM